MVAHRVLNTTVFTKYPAGLYCYKLVMSHLVDTVFSWHWQFCCVSWTEFCNFELVIFSMTSYYHVLSSHVLAAFCVTRRLVRHLWPWHKTFTLTVRCPGVRWVEFYLFDGYLHQINWEFAIFYATLLLVCCIIRREIYQYLDWWGHLWSSFHCEITLSWRHYLFV